MRAAARALGLVTVVAAAVVASSWALPASPASAANAEGCVPLAVIAFRGSGQENATAGVTSHEGRPHPYGDSGLSTNGWEGEQISRMIAAFSTKTGAEGLRAATIPVLAVGPADAAHPYGYPAVAAEWQITGGLRDSAEKGSYAAQVLMQKIKREHGSPAAGCSYTTKFILVGYSQGAMAARFVAAQNPRDVFGVITVGDPLQKPNGSGTFGSGASGGGFVRWDYQTTAWDDYYDQVLNRVGLCHSGDPICDYYDGGVFGGAMRLWKLASTGQHLNYFESTTEADDMAGRLLALAERAERQQGLRAADWRRSDIVLAVDTTRSMAVDLAAVNELSAAVARAAAPGIRIGLVEYRDHDGDFSSRVVTPLTEDADRIAEGVLSLRAGGDAAGSGDAQEAVYSGIATAAGLEWDAEASRSIVVLGDAPQHDPEPVTGHTAAEIADLLAAGSGSNALSAGAEGVGAPIVLYTLDAGDEIGGGLGESLATLVDGTGGRGLAAAIPGDVDDALVEVLADADTAPAASLGVAELVFAGQETLLSAVGSFTADDSSTLEVDLTGDGVFEAAGDPSTGLVAATFGAPGKYTVSLRVTDARGRSSVDTQSVTVLPPETELDGFDPTAPDLVPVLSSPVAGSGDTVLVRADVLDPAESIGIALVPGTDPWGEEPVQLVDAVRADSASLPLPAGLAAGDYSVVLVAADGRWGSAPLTVAAATSPAATASAPTAPAPTAPTRLAETGAAETTGPVATVALALLIAGGLLWSRRRRTT